MALAMRRHRKGDQRSWHSPWGVIAGRSTVMALAMGRQRKGDQRSWHSPWAVIAGRSTVMALAMGRHRKGDQRSWHSPWCVIARATGVRAPFCSGWCCFGGLAWATRGCLGSFDGLVGDVVDGGLNLDGSEVDVMEPDANVDRVERLDGDRLVAERLAEK